MDLRSALKSVSPEGLLSRLPNPRETIISAIDRLPVAREAAYPFVPGETVSAAVAAVSEVVGGGMSATVEYLADAATPGGGYESYFEAVTALAEAGLSTGQDLLVDLRELGLVEDEGALPETTEVARTLAVAASAVGMNITFCGLPHALIDDGLAVHQELVGDFPLTGVTLAAALHRTEADCFDVAALKGRVRLIKREGQEAVGVAFTRAADVDKAYVRCLRILMSGGAHAAIATHDRRLVDIGQALAIRSDRAMGEYSFQFRRGVAGDIATELRESGESVNVLVPYGPQWANYMATKIQVNPAAVGQAARAAVRGGAGQ